MKTEGEQKTWKDKAHRLIAEMCLTEYRIANPEGKKRHVPYRVPELVRQLVDCLGHDDEHGAKAIFMLLTVCPDAGKD